MTLADRTNCAESLDRADEEDEADDNEDAFDITRLSKHAQFLHVLIKVSARSKHALFNNHNGLRIIHH